MNEKGKTEVINITLQVLGILGVFFAGYLLQSLFTLSVFFFICGIIVLQVRIDFEKGVNKE